MIGVQCLCSKVLIVPDSAVGMAGNCQFCRQPMRLVAPGHEGGGAFREKLVIETGPEKVGEMYPLGGPGPIEIGKLATKDISLKGERVSRNHCRLIRTQTGWRIEDQGSTNGIYVNAERTTARELKDRDIVQIGDFALSFLIDGPWLPEQVAPLPPPSAAQPDAAEPPAPPAPPSPPTQARAVSAAPATPAHSPAPALDPTHAPAATPVATSPKKASARGSKVISDDDLYLLSEGDLVSTAVTPPVEESVELLDGPTCPSCKQRFSISVKICVQCGVDLRTGRPILTSSEGDLDRTYTRSETIIWWISWLLPALVLPVASEAFGTRKPYVVWGITLLTVFFSCWFWAYEVSESPKMQSAKDYLLWSGDATPDVGYISWAYNYTPYGDQVAFQTAVDRMEARKLPKGVKPPTSEQIMLTVHNSLTPRQQAFGHFHPYQLVTHVFLHSDLMHLIGNLIFLMVIGSRVNALIGNSATLVLYPLLGIAAALAHMASTRHEMPMPLLGASGAIMGLAGMYLILMPVHKIHMAAWIRIGLLFIGIVPLAIIILLLFRSLMCMLFLFPPFLLLAFLVTYGLRLHLRMFALRGFWVLLFYIGFDVLATVRHSADGVAHWAHLGGFLAGMAAGLILLLARAVNCRSGDVFSGLLGGRAYALIGRPNVGSKRLLEKIW
jgi:membrane associated rhomboid family serine protease